jgi:hypothetical protein
LQKHEVTDIADETKLLQTIKHVLNELDIMSMLCHDQQKLLKLLDDIVNRPGWSPRSGAALGRGLLNDTFLTMDTHQDKQDGKIHEAGEYSSTLLSGGRQDSEHSSLALATAAINTKEIHEMMKRADKLSLAVGLHLSLRFIDTISDIKGSRANLWLPTTHIAYPACRSQAET